MRRIAGTFVMVMVATGLVWADVRTDEKSQVKFEGTLGRMVNLFGGRGAREGIVSTVSVKGDRKMTTTDKTAQIVDLREEKVYELDLSKKTYKVMTFADMRRQIEEARRKAAEQMSREKPEEKAAPAADAQYEVDFDLKESGQKKVINGFNAREIVMTISVHEKGKPLAQNGGMVLTISNWLAPKLPGVSEIAEFDLRFAQKLALPVMADEQQMAAAVAMYPMLAEGMKRMQAENVRMDGTSVLMTMKADVAGPPGAAQESAKEEPKQQNTRPTSIGGLGGALARRALNKKDDKKDSDKEAEAPATPGRVTLMTIENELLKVTPTVTDADVAIPAGFKQQS
jgi:hypothetical protein